MTWRHFLSLLASYNVPIILDNARHIIQHNVSIRFLTHTASHDVANNICQAPTNTCRQHRIAAAAVLLEWFPWCTVTVFASIATRSAQALNTAV
jgi:hypothetical protein